MILKNKKILIIGGTGSLGQVLTKHLYKEGNRIDILSRDETKQWMMQNKFHDYHLFYHICDIRDFDELKTAILNIHPDIIINASAIKQVPACEKFPSESIKTNILGVENLIRICREDYRLARAVLGVSTDKACKPINVYGMCKAIGEKLYTSIKGDGCHTKFICVRYGNVLESRGSIIPFFKYHARTDKIYRLTHPEMTRFFISLDESVKLIVNAIENGEKRDTVVPIVKSGRIRELAELFVGRYGGKIEEIGIRPGEKIHEELINEDEIRRTYRFNENYLVLKPPEHQNGDSQLSPVDIKRYSSDLCLLNKEQLKTYLEKNNVFDKEFETFKEDEVRF